MTEGIVFGVALSLAGFWGITFIPFVKHPLRDIIAGTFWALLPLALFTFLLSERAEGIPFVRPLKRVIISDIKTLFSQSKLFDICLISLFAGFAEELLFRGVIQVKFGIPAASIIFGLVHFITPAYGIFAAILGFYMGILFQRYESILVPIQLHFIYDFCALVYLRYFTGTND